MLWFYVKNIKRLKIVHYFHKIKNFRKIQFVDYFLETGLSLNVE